METITLNPKQFEFYRVVRELYAEECQVPTKRLIANVTQQSIDEVRSLYEQIINKGLVKVTKYGLCLNMDHVSVEVRECE